MNNTPEAQRRYQLRLYQSHPLSVKIKMTQARIREWYRHHGGKVYVAFSGGKDSTVLLDLVWSLYPDVPAVFADTGNELETVRAFVQGYGERVTWVEPKMTFDEVVERYGYPVISKRVARYVCDLRRPKGANEQTKRLRLTGITSKGHSAPSQMLAKKWRFLVEAPFGITNKCCGILKIRPTRPYMKQTGRVPFVGTMADENLDRENSYINHGGCNAFDQGDPQSRPMMFWTEQDVLAYIKDKQLPIAGAYGDIIKDCDGNLLTTGERRTGCKLCLFGIQFEKGENRIQRLARVEPEAYRHCIEDLHYDKVMDYIGVDWRPYQDLFIGA